MSLFPSLFQQHLQICNSVNAFTEESSHFHVSFMPAAHTESRADAMQMWSASPQRPNCVQTAWLRGYPLLFPVAAAMEPPGTEKSLHTVHW